MPNHFHLLVQIKEEEMIDFNYRKQVIQEESAKRIEKPSMISSFDFDRSQDFTFRN